MTIDCCIRQFREKQPADASYYVLQVCLPTVVQPAAHAAARAGLGCCTTYYHYYNSFYLTLYSSYIAVQWCTRMALIDNG